MLKKHHLRQRVSWLHLCVRLPQVMNVSSSCSLVRLSSTSTLTTSQPSPPASCFDWWREREGEREGWVKRRRGEKGARCHGNKGNLLLLCSERSGAGGEFEWAERAFPDTSPLSERAQATCSRFIQLIRTIFISIRLKINRGGWYHLLDTQC